jgi:hypothetical protein
MQPNGGKVGIGTTSPRSELDIIGLLSGGLGAAAVGSGSTADWNHADNIRPGMGAWLLLSGDTNGPGGTSSYYHIINFEYYTKNGSGNITQFGIPYGNMDSWKVFMRGRYNGTWSSWKSVTFA